MSSAAFVLRESIILRSDRAVRLSTPAAVRVGDERISLPRIHEET